jgi:intracellular septation protein
MALAAAQLVVVRIRHRPMATLQWASIALVLVVAALTLLTNNPRFVLVKATLGHKLINGIPECAVI